MKPNNIYVLGLVFLYRNVKNAIAAFNPIENELERIMIQSSFNIPYQVHKASPVNNTASIIIERSFPFFSLINFIN